MFKKSSIISIFIISIFITDHLYASCGRCGADLIPATKKSNALVTGVSESRNVEGLVIASCGMCNFGLDAKAGCSLTIKIGETTYSVKGTGIDDHGDSHAKDGFCNAVSVVSVVGNVKDNLFLAESFEFQKK